MENTPTIRPAVISELPILLEFEQKIIEAERPFDSNLGRDINYYDIRALIESDHAQVLVAEINGNIVGSGYAMIKASKTYMDHRKHSYLGFMYVKPDHRGQGIIQLIIESLKQWSKDQNLTDVYLEVYAKNEKAVRAYKKIGFNESLLEMKVSI